MPLIEFWKTSPKTALGMNLPVIVNMATNGERLRDGSEGSREFRQYLGEMESDKLADYATYCIENAFTDSGQVLQDVVNEIGRRLGFTAENGRYQGVRNDIGFDGIWSAGGESLVVEVKTTDAYNIRLEVIARYRDRLEEAGRIPKDTPILIVIGRNDTASLEAQVRGSRYAWTMRIVGIDALIKLMDVNLSTSSESVTEKIHTILRPFEYTRIDQIVDVVFTAAEDKENEVQDMEPVGLVLEDGKVGTQDRTPKSIIDQKKVDAVAQISAREGRALQKKRHSMYADVDGTIHAVVVVSKRYEKDNGYWYAYHEEPQRRFLSQAANGYMVLGMTDKDFVIAVPFKVLEAHWDDLFETVTKNGRMYKHILTYERDGHFTLRVRNKGSEIALDPYVIL